jgi:hypothetical protein
MAGEVLPEVAAKAKEEARRAAEEKLRLARELAKELAAGKVCGVGVWGGEGV